MPTSPPSAHSGKNGRPAFQEGFVGLQIIWEVEGSHELEFISLEVLQEASTGQQQGSTGAVSYNRAVRPRSYRYPVEMTTRPGEIRLTYAQDPPDWMGVDYEMIRGRTTIYVSDDGITPNEVWFKPENDAEFKVDRDLWEFQSKPKSVPNFADSKRKRIARITLERKGQRELRAQLLAMYGCCQLTGCAVPETLEACHIVPVANNGPDRSDNALLLRCDLHALFDAGLMKFAHEGGAWTPLLRSDFKDKDYRALLKNKQLPGFALYEPYLKEREELERLEIER